MMDAAARVTSKGQVTVPKAVRDALGIMQGDQVVFRVEGNRAVLARTPDFLSLADTVRVRPPGAMPRGTTSFARLERPAPPSAIERVRRHECPRPASHRRPARDGRSGDRVPTPKI